MKFDRFISRDPSIMLGKPVIKGTQITTESIYEKFVQGYLIQDIKREYPHLSKVDIKAAILYHKGK